jgi:MSHA biogenesis protein MshL
VDKQTRNSIMLKRIAIAIFIFMLIGCTGHMARKQSDKDIKQVKNEIRLTEKINTTVAAMYVTEPPASTVPRKIERLPSWSKTPYKFTASKIPFFYVAEDMVKRHGIHVTYGPQVDINQKVQFSFNGEGNVYQAMKALASSSGYHFETKDDSVSWSAFIYETFDVAYAGGTYNYSIGSEAGSDQQASGLQGQSLVVGGNDDQFSNVSADDLNIFEDLEKSLGSIVGLAGEVNVSQASTSVIVKTTPARMTHVRRYMQSMEDRLAKAIVLQFKVLRFTSKNNTASGVDWSLLRTAASNTLSFDSSIVSSVTQSLFSGAPTSFGVTRNEGSLSGSQLLISALEEQGDVSIVTERQIHTLINRAASIDDSELTGYIARTETTTNQDANPSISIEPGTVKDGYSIHVITNADRYGRIYMHVSSTLADLLKISRKEVGSSAIETPQVSESKFNQTAILRNGETMVLNSTVSVTNETGGVSPLSAKYLPTYRSGRKDVQETLVLVTPIILDTSVR